MISDLRFHHMGTAVANIDETLNAMKQLLTVDLLSDIIFDPIQEVELVLLDVGGLKIELVSGKKVSRFIPLNGISFYHMCYETINFEHIIETFRNMKGVILVSSPQPAILFNHNRVAFFMLKNMGLIEILERKA